VSASKGHMLRNHTAGKYMILVGTTVLCSYIQKSGFTIGKGELAPVN